MLFLRPETEGYWAMGMLLGARPETLAAELAEFGHDEVVDPSSEQIREHRATRTAEALTVLAADLESWRLL